MTRRKNFVTARFIVVLGVWQLLGVASLLWGTWLYFYLGFIPIIGFLVYRDYHSLPTTGQFSLSFEGSSRLYLEEETQWQWNLSLQANVGGRPNRAVLFCPSSSLFHSEQFAEALPKLQDDSDCWQVHQMVRGGSLGQETVEELVLTSFSTLGWWQGVYRIPLQDKLQIHVKPSIRPLPKEQLARTLRHVQHLLVGSRTAIRNRMPEQLHSIRRYRYPDEIRYVDAKKSARYQRLMVKDYESYSQHQLVIALDLGRSLAGSMGASRKKDFYLEGAMTLYRAALEAGDQVSLFGFHQDLTGWHQGSKGFHDIQKLIDQGKKFQVLDVESQYELIPSAIQRYVHQRSIVVVLTDPMRPSVQEPLMHNLKYLSRRHLSLSVGIIEEKYSMNFDAGSASQSTAAWANDLYRCWLDEEFELFSRKMSRINSGAIVCSERHWLDMNRKLYQLLRSSLLA